MAITADKVWLDGEMVDFADAKIHILSHTLHYGLGAFEGIRSYRRADGRAAIFRLREHIKRLFDTCHICTMEIPFTREEIEQACIDTVRANGFKDCYIRPVVFLGDGFMGLGALANKVRVGIIAWEWGSYLGEEGLQKGIRAKVSSFNRHHVNASMVKGKINGQYVNSVLAKREVMAMGYHEAIMLDTEGYVSEASGENMFLVIDGQIYTTPLGASILGGITRDTVMRLAHERNYKIHLQRFTRDMMYTADEVFMTGTAAEVTPVREIDDRKIGAGEPGPVTREIQAAYFDLVKGAATDHQEWLAFVN